MSYVAFAHSADFVAEEKWEPLSDHLALVGEMAGRFADRFDASGLGIAAGRLHDIGKTSAAFQAYIRPNGGLRGPDHSTAGAREAMRLYGPGLGRILAFCIAGHHAGLADGGSVHVPGTLSHRLVASQIEDYSGWERHAGVLPEFKSISLPAP